MIINSKHGGGGITPTGNINITDTNVTDVTNYETAQVVDADLVSENIKKDVNILGVVGSFEGGDPVINPLLYVKSVSNFSQVKNLPRIFSLHFGSYVTSLASMMLYAEISGDTDGSELTIDADGTITSMSSMLSNMENKSYQTVKINFDTSHVTYWSKAFYYNYKLRVIEGELNFSSATNISDIFYTSQYAGDGLRTITIAKNTIPLSISFANQRYLTNETIINIANGLNETITGQTLTLHSTPKSVCSTIMGNVTMDESNTYHIFTADASGTVTLENFITQTKGWTIA